MHLAAFSLPSFAHLSIDWIIIAAFILLLAFEAIRSGSGRASVLAIAFPVSAFLFNLIPHTFLIGKAVAQFSTPVMQAGLFGVVFVIVFLLAYRIVYTIPSTAGGFLFACLSSLAAAMMALAIWIQMPALQAVWHFGPQIQSAFSAPYTLFWLVGSYLILAFVRS